MESSLSFFSPELCLWCHMWERLQSSPPRFSSFQFQVLHFSVPSILRSPLYMMQGTVHHSRRQMSWSFCWKRKIVPEYFFAFYLPHRAVESKFPGKLTTASYSLALRWILQWSTALPFWKGLEWAPALTFSSPLVWVSFIFLFLFFGSLLVGSQNSGCSVHIILSQQLHILGSFLWLQAVGFPGK